MSAFRSQCSSDSPQLCSDERDTSAIDTDVAYEVGASRGERRLGCRAVTATPHAVRLESEAAGSGWGALTPFARFSEAAVAYAHEHAAWRFKYREWSDDSMFMQKKTVMPGHRCLPLLLTLVVLALPGYTLVQSAGAGTTSTVHHVPTSIDRTGTTDVSGAINAYIASVPDGSTIVFPGFGALSHRGRRPCRCTTQPRDRRLRLDVLRHDRREPAPRRPDRTR